MFFQEYFIFRKPKLSSINGSHIGVRVNIATVAIFTIIEFQNLAKNREIAISISRAPTLTRTVKRLNIN